MMATGGSSDISQGTSMGVLSAEQLHRMEENRRRAREKLAGKRSGLPLTGMMSPPVSETLGPPVAKRPTLDTGKLTGSSYLTNSGTSAQAPNLNPRPFLDSKLNVSRFQNTAPGSTKKFMFGSSARKYNKAHSSSAVSAHSGPLQMKFNELQKAVKANLTLVSRTRFKVLVPYDPNLIDIFKQIPSRSYDAKTLTWSFGVEDYNMLVEMVQKNCKYVQLSLVPKPVIALFLSQLRSKSSQLRSKSSQLQSKSSQLRSKGEVVGEGRGTDGTDGGVDWGEVDEKLKSTLMQFQKDGVEYCIRHGGRVLIADDMGLGKTLQAIAVMCYYRSHWPLLVVCPSSVRFTWAEAFKQWVPSLSEEDVNVVLSAKNSATSGLVNIISYDLLVKMVSEVHEKKFRAIIADESHFLKNHKTARSKATLPIIKGANCALLLSGTPALSRPIELFTQITALDKSFKISLVDFGLRYCNGVKNHFGWDFSGASNMHELQMYMEDRIMIRRLKSEVLDQLPSKRRQMVLLDPSMTKGKSKEWKEMRQELDRAGKLKPLDRKGALLPLFNKTGKMKIPAIRDYILDMMEGGRKLIVFGHHKVVLDAICESLEDKKHDYIRIDGCTPAELRQSYCDRFQHDEQCLVAVLSITTANAGLTLTAASTVVFAELFWNPGILVQAEDRAYRIGQKSSVNIHYLVARDTADDFIWPLIQCKLDVLNQAGLAKEDFSEADSTVLKDASQRGLLECFEELVMTVDVPSTSEESQTIEPAPPPATQSEGKSRSTHILERLPDDPDFKEEKHFVTVGTKNSKESTTSCQTSGKVVDLSSGSAQPALNFVSARESRKQIATLHSIPPPEVMQEQTDRMYQVAPTGGKFDDDVSDWFADLDHQELLQFEKFDEEGQNCTDF